MKRTRALENIVQFTRPAHYRINISWGMLEDSIKRYEETSLAPLNLIPDFQRGHIWTKEQQILYVEFKLRRGQEANVILLNCPGWMDDWKGPFELVDGLQRITAVRKFMNNEIPAFDDLLGHYEDAWTIQKGLNPDFIFAINNLETRAEVLTWYLELNYQGIPHSEEELNKVRELLRKEQKKS